jgi:hypothetical protein
MDSYGKSNIPIMKKTRIILKVVMRFGKFICSSSLVTL